MSGWNDRGSKVGNNIGVIIGRFQPIHMGHVSLFKKALSENLDYLYVFVGSAYSPVTFKNPFDFSQRQLMIEELYNSYIQNLVNCNTKLRIIGVDDEWNDTKWREQFDILLNLQPDLDIKNCNVFLYGHDKDATTYYLKNLFPEWILVEVGKEIDIDATTIRNEFFLNGEDGLFSLFQQNVIHATTANFLKLFIKRYSEIYKSLSEEYAYMIKMWSQYSGLKHPVTFVTVDAILQVDNQILFIRRKEMPSKGFYALPGGFVAQNETLRQSVNRVVLEKTGIDISELKESNKFEADNPNRSLRGRTISFCYHFVLPKYISKKIKTSDDKRLIYSFDIRKFANMIYEDHKLIAERALTL